MLKYFVYFNNYEESFIINTFWSSTTISAFSLCPIILIKIFSWAKHAIIFVSRKTLDLTPATITFTSFRKLFLLYHNWIIFSIVSLWNFVFFLQLFVLFNPIFWLSSISSTNMSRLRSWVIVTYSWFLNSFILSFI